MSIFDEGQTNVEISSTLQKGEKLVWAGVPKRGIQFRSEDAYMVPFSLFWCGFIYFWLHSALHSRAPLWFILFATPFVLVGIYLLFGRLLWEAWERARTRYVLTNQRAIIVTHLFSRRVRSVFLHRLEDTSLTLRQDGSGTITLGPPQPTYTFWSDGGRGTSDERRFTPPKFEFIDDAQRVYDLLLQHQRTAASETQR